MHVDDDDNRTVPRSNLSTPSLKICEDQLCHYRSNAKKAHSLPCHSASIRDLVSNQMGPCLTRGSLEQYRTSERMFTTLAERREQNTAGGVSRVLKKSRRSPMTAMMSRNLVRAMTAAVK